MRKLLKRSVIIALALIAHACISLSQPYFWAELRVQDCNFQTIIDTFGYACNATRCIDGDLGNGFVEKELPDIPPSVIFDAFFIDPRGFDPDCLGQGVRLNIVRAQACGTRHI